MSFFPCASFVLFSLSVVDEELLLGVCPKWTVSVRCVRHCDVHVLHRSLFIAAVNEMRGSEEEREVQCLLALVKGRWEEERAVLAWPLFHGFDYFCAVRMTLRPGHFSPESQTPTANHRFQTAAASKKQLHQAFNRTSFLHFHLGRTRRRLSQMLSRPLCRIHCRLLCLMASTALPAALSNALANSMPSDMHSASVQWSADWLPNALFDGFDYSSECCAECSAE